MGSQSRIRTLIADDEPLAQDLLRNLVMRDPELELVAIAASGAETLSEIERCQPQLILLDIQMPNLDGISVAEQLAGRDDAPYIVYVTAHDNFALQAFSLAVRDYIVKPISKQRFAAAIHRAKTDLRSRQDPSQDRVDQALILRQGDTLHRVDPVNVIWAEAANQYCRLHTTAQGKLMLSRSLRQFMSTASATGFVRIHRSVAVNASHLTAVEKQASRLRVRVSDGTRLNVARSRRSLAPALLAYVERNTTS